MGGADAEVVHAAGVADADFAEGVELALQVREGSGWRLPGQPAFLGLVEPLVF